MIAAVAAPGSRVEDFHDQRHPHRRQESGPRAGVRLRVRTDAGPRHRRQHRHLQRHQRCNPAPAPVSRGRPHHAPATAAGRRRRRGLVVLVSRSGALSVAVEDDRSVRRIRRLDVQRPRAWRAAPRHRRSRHCQLLSAAGRAAARRAHARPGGRSQGRTAGRRPHPRLLAARLRIRSVDRGPDDRPDREEGGNRRRAEARVALRDAAHAGLLRRTTPPTTTTWARRCRTSGRTG